MKKITSLFLALAMVFAVNAAVFAQSEPDEWAVSEVDFNAAEFLKAAMGEFDYKKEITREEFAIIALYIYGSVTDMNLPEMSVENPFTDSDNPFVVTAYGLGLVKGVSETEFNPKASITREQMCVMLMRIAENLVPDFNMEYILPYLPNLTAFADGDMVSDYAKDYVKLSITAGLIKGTDENKINPLGNLTVQEALIVAKRAVNIDFDF